MKNIIRTLSCALALLMLLLAVSGCSGNAAYNSYDRTGERYDYDLTEYVKVCDYTGIKLPNISYTPTEMDIRNSINTEIAVYSPFEKGVNRPAQNGDRVVITSTCYIDGKVYSYFTFTDNSEGEGHSFILGNNEFDVMEIEEAIVGMSAGETKEISFTFPDPYFRDILTSGKEATMEILLERVDEIDYLTGDDDFYEERFGYTRAGRENEIRNNLQQRYDGYLSSYKVVLAWQYILDNSKLKKVPEKEYNALYESLLDNYRSQAESTGKTLRELVVDMLGYEDMDPFYADLKERAEQTVFEEMILYYVARCENLNFNETYYEDALLEYGNQYELDDAGDVELFLNSYGILEQFQETIRFRYVQEWIAAQGNVQENVHTVNGK